MNRNKLDKLKKFLSSTPPEEEPAVPKFRLGRYEVIGQIARGGMATVYEARDPELKRTIALKVIRDTEVSETVVRRLHLEAAAAAKLRHPNIVSVHEVGHEAGTDGAIRYYIAMDRVNGETFQEEMPGLGRKERLEVLETVAKTVAYAHEHGVVHRDLKPANILIEQRSSEERWVFLTDFGLARIEDGEDLTRAGTVLGTPHYMAPEQVRGESGNIGPWTDVWALGVMLGEILTGQTPFTGSSAYEIYESILKEEPHPIPGNVHRDLKSICRKAMRKDPQERYSSAAEFAEDLRRVRSGEPIQAQPPSRVRTPALVTVGVLLLATVLLLFLPLGSDPTGDVPGTTYHVAMNCSDGNPGTGDSPWATLQFAADHVLPGDLVLVREGTYPGFRIRISGREGAPIIFRAVGDGVRIQPPKEGPASVILYRVSYVTVEGFRIHRAERAGIFSTGVSPRNRSRGLVLRNNHILDSRTNGILLHNLESGRIEGNEIHRSGRDSPRRSEEAGIHLTAIGDAKLVIEKNHISENSGSGIVMATGSTAKSETALSGVVVTGNLIVRNGSNGIEINGAQDLRIQNNVIWKNARHGIRGYRQASPTGLRGLVVVHNSILAGTDGGWCVALSGKEGGHVVFNNILLNQNPAAGSFRLESPEAAQIHGNHNVVVARFSFDGGDRVVGLPEWRRRGYGADSVVSSAEREFEDATKEGYRTRTTAAAVDLGAESLQGHTAPRVDLEGTERPLGNGFDAGSYERGSAGN